MADPKTKPVNGNHVPDKAKLNGNHVPDKSSKQSKLWQMLALAKDVAKDAETVEDFEKSMEEKKVLEQEIEARTGEVKNLRDLNAKVMREFTEYKSQANVKTDTLFAEFEQKYKTYDSNKAAVEEMEKQVGDLKDKLAAAELNDKTGKEKVDKLQQRVQSADAHANELAKEIKEMNSECEIHRSQMETGVTELDACKAKLAEAKTDLGDGVLHDYGPEGLRQLGLDLKALSKKCHALVVEYFNDTDGAKDSASEIQELKTRFPKVPLTTAATKSAAQMRGAVAEAVIAEVLSTQIFVPFYLANGVKDSAASLLKLFGDDEKRRAIYRCQILRSIKDAEEVARIEDDIVRKASNEVRTTLHPLVVAFKQAGFFNAIPAFFRDALKLWATVQRSRDLITAEPPDLNEVQPPGKYEEYDGPNGGTKAAKGAPAAKPSIAAVLFPQVASREDLIFNGLALWSTQGALMAAAQEAGAPPQGPNGPVVVNGTNTEPLRHQRRRSVVAAELPLKGRQIRNGA